MPGARANRPERFDLLAQSLGLGDRLRGGDPALVIRGVAPLSDADGDDLAFVRSGAYADAGRASGAGALVVPADFEDRDGASRPILPVGRPDLIFARLAEHLFSARALEPGIAPGANVAGSAVVDPSASVGAGAFVGDGATIGAGTVVHPNAAIYTGVSIGANCEIHAGVVVREGTRIGDRVRLQPNVVLGADGFGLVPDEGGAPQRMPQVGIVVIEDDVQIGAGTTVDRATMGETRIRRGARIDNLVMIGHNCDVGEETIVIAQTGLSGSTEVGRRAVLMAQSGTAGHLRIGQGALLGARAGVHRDVPEGLRVWGWPAAPEREWHKRMQALARLPELLKRLRRLERRLSPKQGGEPE